MNSLSSVINNSTLSAFITASTPSTLAVKYVYGVLSSAATSVQCAITVIKSGMRQQPPTQVGQVVKST
jgi:hypothetical protein